MKKAQIGNANNDARDCGFARETSARVCEEGEGSQTLSAKPLSVFAALFAARIALYNVRAT